ncbi:MAG: hypothetical protein GKR90_09545 [Pseudomonadales bacterium]|nr:hypothetical protein [Pseudomonadales bacterium]
MKPFEYWHPRLAEAPYYAALLLRCAAAGLPPKFLAKANYALDHGELGLGSKYRTQLAFDQVYFPTTELIDFDRSDIEEINVAIGQFVHNHENQAILKPDIGAVGKGVLKISGAASPSSQLPELSGQYLLQAYCDLPEEFGIFFVRQQGNGRITGVNRKHFPTVIGDGQSTITQLAERHERFTNNWQIFMQYQDGGTVLAADEERRLSFIGSHTMGCKFTNDRHLVTTSLTNAISQICANQPGFNFGRLDVRAASEAHLQRGEFIVIEVNGVASLPTHMFDPDLSVQEAYRIFLLHAKLLVDIANENRHQPMTLKPYSELWQQAKQNHALLNQLHERSMRNPQSP